MNTYSIGYNMPGYMPDNEPSECETLEDAKEALLTDITHYLEDINLDSEFSDSDVKIHVKTLQIVESEKPQTCNVYIGNYVFWITEV